MEIYNQIIRGVAELTGKSAPQRYAYDPSRAWEDAGAFELIMAREAAFELGGDNLPAVNFTCVTTSPELLTIAFVPSSSVTRLNCSQLSRMSLRIPWYAPI